MLGLIILPAWNLYRTPYPLHRGSLLAVRGFDDFDSNLVQNCKALELPYPSGYIPYVIPLPGAQKNRGVIPVELRHTIHGIYLTRQIVKLKIDIRLIHGKTSGGGSGWNQDQLFTYIRPH